VDHELFAPFLLLAALGIIGLARVYTGDTT
jgi:hypothetical protein